MVAPSLQRYRSVLTDRYLAAEVLVLTSAIWLLVQSLRYVFPPLFDAIQVSYGVSNTETGSLFTLLLVGYSVVQFPAGAFSDRVGKTTVITIGAVGFALAAFVSFLSPSFVWLTVGAILIGITTGVHKTVAIPFLSNEYGDRKGLALGVMDTVGQFGGVIAPLFVVGVLASMAPWNTVFLIGAIVSAGIAVAFYFRVHVSRSEPTAQPSAETNSTLEPDGGSSETSRLSTYASVFDDRTFVTFLLVIVIFTFSWNGVSSFLPLFLADQKGISLSTAGVLYSLLFFASMSQTATGWLSDTAGRRTILLVTLVLMIGGMASLLVVESVGILAVTIVLTGIGFHGFRPVRDSCLVELIPESVSGGTLGIVRTIMTGIGSVSPVLVGFISDQAGFEYAFAVLIALLILAFFLLSIIRLD